MGGFDFSQVVGYQNGVVMPFQLISKVDKSNDIEANDENDENAETVEEEKPTRKPKAKK